MIAKQTYDFQPKWFQQFSSHFDQEDSSLTWIWVMRNPKIYWMWCNRRWLQREVIFIFFLDWFVPCIWFLKQFGEIEAYQIDDDNRSAVITYKSRAEAEQVSALSHCFDICVCVCVHMYVGSTSFSCLTCSFSTPTCKAALHGAKFKTQPLRLAWHKAVTAVSSEDPDEAEPEDDDVCEP